MTRICSAVTVRIRSSGLSLIKQRVFLSSELRRLVSLKPFDRCLYNTVVFFYHLPTEKGLRLQREASSIFHVSPKSLRRMPRTPVTDCRTRSFQTSGLFQWRDRKFCKRPFPRTRKGIQKNFCICQDTKCNVTRLRIGAALHKTLNNILLLFIEINKCLHGLSCQKLFI